MEQKQAAMKQEIKKVLQKVLNLIAAQPLYCSTKTIMVIGENDI